MNQQAEKVLRVFVLAIIATIILKLLLVIYFLYKVLIKKEDIFR